MAVSHTYFTSFSNARAQINVILRFQIRRKPEQGEEGEEEEGEEEEEGAVSYTHLTLPTTTIV